MAIATAAVFGAQAVMGYVNESKEAKAQQQYQDAQNKQAYASARNQYSQLSYQESDSVRDSVEKSMDSQVEAQQAAGRANLMAAATGTAGLSVDEILMDIQQQQGRNMSTLASNRATEAFNIRQQADSIRYGTRIDTRKISKPSVISGVTSVATSAASGYSQGAQLQSLRKQAAPAKGGV